MPCAGWRLPIGGGTHRGVEGRAVYP